jgi:hypothetical protein
LKRKFRKIRRENSEKFEEKIQKSLKRKFRKVSGENSEKFEEKIQKRVP